ncbi:hypothetical protein [Streptomyces sp. NBC_00887]|uniref:hypothetical protein n=1 Tax=Streptomyces sp. NBC_00887 TaxID=2975859 RepID=UPI00386B4B13|nr:hypothetical protein OG844_10225 [Streptomyces sp. NBC_00887]WSY34610.1 hypothetical protein OG844_35375 [Streptomyces sp. NBC_00887]
MTPTDRTPARLRLDAALHGLTGTFRGMTAAPDEDNCECHWGSAEDLARLKTPDVVLDPDLLRRTWQAIDWRDHGAVLRRILPQFATALVGGQVEPIFDMGDVGQSFGRGRWQRWPGDQAAAVREFLHAWWADSLTAPDTVVPAHDVFALCAEASGTVTPWLAVWDRENRPTADRRLVEAVDQWEFDLLGGKLPWYAWDHDEKRIIELSNWLADRAPARLSSQGAPEEMHHWVRLLGLPGPARWEDPHWPGYTY